MYPVFQVDEIRAGQGENMSESEDGGRRIEAKDLRCQERTPLEQVIPLPAPYVVYIDPTNVCNFKCQFCPTAYPDLIAESGRTQGLMKMDLFRKIVDDISGFGVKLKLASIYKDGEPLLNKHFPEMIRHLRQADVAERIWTKTNGSRLDPELNAELAECGLDMICIGVEAVTNEGYRKIALVDVDYEKFRGNVKDLYERRGRMQIYVKIADSGFSPAEIEKFYRDFQPISTHIAVEKLMGWSNSSVKDFTLGTNPDTYDGLPLVPKEVCAYPFYVLAVNSDGSVSLCGNDWSHGTVVGNVKEQSLVEIWNGDRLYEFRKTMLSGHRCDLKACANCYYLQIVPDNLDAHARRIFENLTQERDSRHASLTASPSS